MEDRLTLLVHKLTVLISNWLHVVASSRPRLVPVGMIIMRRASFYWEPTHVSNWAAPCKWISRRECSTCPRLSKIAKPHSKNNQVAATTVVAICGKPTRKALPKATKSQWLKRQNFSVLRSTFPHSEGGSNAADNIVAACLLCNIKEYFDPPDINATVNRSSLSCAARSTKACPATRGLLNKKNSRKFFNSPLF